jgi:hypothetical protein
VTKHLPGKLKALSSNPSTIKKKREKIENKPSQAPMAHTCNPSYSGGRDKVDHGSKPAWGNSSQDPILKKPNKKGLVEWLKV